MGSGFIHWDLTGGLASPKPALEEEDYDEILLMQEVDMGEEIFVPGVRPYLFEPVLANRNHCGGKYQCLCL